MIRKDLSVAIIQSELVWENKAANLTHFEEKISQVGECDLIILPEMFSTGFSMRPEKLAEETESSLKWIRKLSDSSGAAICGSVMVFDNGQYFNRLLFVEPTGKFYHYDKRHLFTMGSESKQYSAGKDRLIINYLGWKILPLVCYDLRFPVFSRNDCNYDLLLYVANWPARRAHHWKSLLLARAIENQCYVAACNRVGIDGNGVEHSGDSMMIDCWGNVLQHAENKSTILKASFSSAELTVTREKFPVLNDSDDFEADWKGGQE